MCVHALQGLLPVRCLFLCSAVQGDGVSFAHSWSRATEGEMISSTTERERNRERKRQRNRIMVAVCPEVSTFSCQVFLFQRGWRNCCKHSRLFYTWQLNLVLVHLCNNFCALQQTLQPNFIMVSDWNHTPYVP